MNLLNLIVFLHLHDSIRKLDNNPLDFSFLAPALYREAEKRGADSNLLSFIGSFGDTLSDEELLEIMRDVI